MQIIYINPTELKSNSWNPNVVDPINFDKLITSLRSDGLQKAILIRTLHDGSYEILDGQHRVEAAKQLGWDEIACVNMGLIDAGAAKKQTLIGNSRYGDDDPLLMNKLLSDDSLGSAESLLESLPFDEESLMSYFEHASLDELNLDDLDDEEEGNALDLDEPASKPTKTHQIVRFKIGIEDAVCVSDLITKIKHEQGFTESDDLTNAGDALVYLATRGQV